MPAILNRPLTRAALLIAVGCMVIAMLAIGIHVSQPARAASPPSSTPMACKSFAGVSGTKFFASEAPAGSNHNGPTVPAIVNGDTAAATTAMSEALCADPNLVAQHVSAELGRTDPQYKMDTNGMRAFALKLIGNKELWKDTLGKLSAHEATAKTVEVQDLPAGGYQSYYQVLDNGVVPSIYVGAVDESTFRAIVYTYADGSKDMIKLDCFFQPVAPQLPGTFLGLPPQPTPAPPAPQAPEVPTCSYCTPTTAPPVTVPPTTAPPVTVPPCQTSGKCANPEPNLAPNGVSGPSAGGTPATPPDNNNQNPPPSGCNAGGSCPAPPASTTTTQPPPPSGGPTAPPPGSGAPAPGDGSSSGGSGGGTSQGSPPPPSG